MPKGAAGVARGQASCTNGATVTSTRATEYRHLAQECLILSRSASTEQARNALVEMSRNWFRLAEAQDDESASVEWAGPITTPAAPARPPAQQQQQVQPKDDDKKD
jgi:hypothetical protein